MRKIAALIIVACVSFGTAHAAFTTWMDASPKPYTEGFQFSPGAALDFPQWDPASYPGMYLVGAEIELTGKLSGQNTWTLTGGDNQTVVMYEKGEVHLKDPGAGPDLVVSIPIQQDYWYGQNGGDSGIQVLVNSDTQNGFVPGASLPLFQGAGTVSAGLWTDNTQYGYVQGAGGGVSLTTTFDPVGNAEAKIQYEYEQGSIPEPGTLALVGFGLLGLVGIVRRRRTK